MELLSYIEMAVGQNIWGAAKVLPLECSHCGAESILSYQSGLYSGLRLGPAVYHAPEVEIPDNVIATSSLQHEIRLEKGGHNYRARLNCDFQVHHI
jgi:hypothetical protein